MKLSPGLPALNFVAPGSSFAFGGNNVALVLGSGA